MATYRFEIRSTGRPFGPCEPLSDGDFQYSISRHTTLSAARKQLRRESAEMHVRCGTGSLAAWDDHYALFAIRATRLTQECEICEHPFSTEWLAGSTAPHESLCPECRAGETAITALPAYQDAYRRGTHDGTQQRAPDVFDLTDRMPIRTGYERGYVEAGGDIDAYYAQA